MDLAWIVLATCTAIASESFTQYGYDEDVRRVMGFEQSLRKQFEDLQVAGVEIEFVEVEYFLQNRPKCAESEEEYEF
jgi:hypothetical protein